MKRTPIFFMILIFSMRACGPGQLFDPIASENPSSIPSATATFASTVSSTPEKTPIPTFMPTPIGYGSGELLYQIYSSNFEFKGLYTSERGLIISKTQIDEKIGSDFAIAFLNPSPNGALVVLSLGREQNQPASTYDWSHFIISIDQNSIMPIRYTGMYLDHWFWSSDSSKLLGTGDDGTGKRKEYCVADSTDGRIITCISADINNRDAYWSEDDSHIYWSKKGQLWMASLEDTKGSYVGLTFLPDQLELNGMSFSPDSTKVAIINNIQPSTQTLFLANSNFTSPIKSITFFGDPYFFINWSSDSRYLFWTAYPSGTQYLIDASTGEDVQFPSPEGSTFCGWSQDNKVIAYIENGTLYIASISNPSLRRQVAAITSDELLFCSTWILK